MTYALLERLPDLEIGGEEQWLACNNHTGLMRLPVRFSAAPVIGRGNVR